MLLQPLLHELVTCVCAPTTVLSGRDGQIEPYGAQGAFHADVRVLSLARLLVDDRLPETVASVLDGPSAARFTALVRWLGDRGADPSVRIERRRVATATGLIESLSVVSSAGVAVDTVLVLDLESDFASIDAIKAGRAAPSPALVEVFDGVATWRSTDGVVVSVSAGTATMTGHARGVRLEWPLVLAPGASYDVYWELVVTDPAAVVTRPSATAPWRRPTAQADDRRLDQLVEQSLDDLESLRLVLPGRPHDQFLAAGSPWFLTLFGRDSLWAARMMLPLGTELAAGTLTALASLQGRQDDDGTEESPGKIMHELRRGSFGIGEHRAGQEVVLPPVYYGTVDATALWVILLHDAWLWGLSAEVVEGLLPSLEAAVAWLTGPADADGDGFLEYIDRSGHGLANQGWKDSGDSVRFRDGTQAVGPVALVEVQGYAYEAAGGAAALLTAFGRPGGDRLLAWRDALAQRFRTAFWVEDSAGPFPALALDGRKRPVDALTSNVGHLLGTGILTPAEAATVARRLLADDMDSGYGLRTMSARTGGFSALSYHCGSVWPHDTAIVVHGLVREGLGSFAAPLIDGLLTASSTFSGRLPELWAGDAAAEIRGPVPYPAACRPQAWSAATAVSLVRDLLGLAVDVPRGVVSVNPLAPAPAGALDIRGLQVAGQALDVATDATGQVRQLSALQDLRVVLP
ncbi:glycogen debranching N-terminal domain-containing protein [Acidothermaceae bacterium B102]|nr:glycogen debranching N-terminal domain-containing protein [Acidothermaceae bacterium B102]